jgi:hypothetical protein
MNMQQLKYFALILSAAVFMAASPPQNQGRGNGDSVTLTKGEKEVIFTGDGTVCFVVAYKNTSALGGNAPRKQVLRVKYHDQRIVKIHVDPGGSTTITSRIKEIEVEQQGGNGAATWKVKSV